MKDLFDNILKLGNINITLVIMIFPKVKQKVNNNCNFYLNKIQRAFVQIYIITVAYY